MTETQWQTATTPGPMLKFIGPKASARKLQLLGVACCRLTERQYRLKSADHFDDIRTDHLVNLAERHAEGDASRDEWRTGHDLALSMANDWSDLGGADVVSPATAFRSAILALVSTPLLEGTERVLQWSAATAARAADAGQSRNATQAMRRKQADLLREVFGNPFAERTVVPAWMSTGGSTIFPGYMIRVSETAKALADGIQADQAFERLPILADAMEEAGCTDTDFLAHLREPGHHVRGCWALDLVLGKG